MKKSGVFLAVVIMVLFAVFLTACSTGERVEISFSFNDGGTTAAPRPVYGRVGEEFPSLPSPVRKGYTFGGWFYDAGCETAVLSTDKVPAESLLLYAKWLPSKVTINFIINDLSLGIHESFEIEADYGGSILKTAMPTFPEVQGFRGEWNPSELINITAPLTVRGNYIQNTNAVTFVVDGIKAQEFSGLPGDAYGPVAVPEKAGYYFKGWYSDADLTVREDKLPDVISDYGAAFYAGFAFIGDNTNYFTYTSSGGGYVVTGLTAAGRAQRDLVIPSIRNNLPVNRIGSGGEVFISDSIKTIIVPSSVTAIRNNAFANSSASEVIIESGSLLTSIGASAFENCENLASFFMPDSVNTIGEGIFAGCTKLIRLSIGFESNLTAFSEGFLDGTNVSNVNIPNSVATVTTEDFVGSAVESFVSAHDGLLNAHGGAIYSGDFSVLILYAPKGASAYTVIDDAEEIFDYAFSHSNIASVVFGEGLRIIGDYAFYGCSELLTVYFGESSVTEIGESAFENAVRLTEMVLPDSLQVFGNYAFKGTAALTKVTLNGTYTEIPAGLLSGCTSLQTLTIPARITKIHDDAFRGFENLTSVIFDGNSEIAEIGKYAFADCVRLSALTLPAVIKIGEGAFSGCRMMSFSEFNTVRLAYIGDYAFRGTALSSFDLPRTLTYLGKGAFKNCQSLTRFQPANATNISGIPDELLENCIRLTMISFPPNIETIGARAFFGCVSLASASFAATGLKVREIGDSAFEGCSVLQSAPQGVVTLLPSTLTKLGERAFANCNALININIPKNLAVIEKEAFYSCRNLESVLYLTEPSLHTIGENAFAYCVSIVSFQLPSALISRDAGNSSGAVKNPFVGCSRLTEFTFSTGNKGDFILENGVVYLKNLDGSKTLYLYPTGRTGSYTVPGDVSKIDKYALYGCLVSAVNFDRSLGGGTQNIWLTEIGDYAFASCGLLISITVSGRIYKIGAHAFEGCGADVTASLNLQFEDEEIAAGNPSYAIQNTGITDNRLTIGAYAFANSDIANLTVPARITVIEDGAFSGSGNLSTLTFADGNPFGNLIIGRYAFFENSALKNSANASNVSGIVLPLRLAEIGDYAFARCYNLPAVNFSDTLLSADLIIGEYAFSNCHYLRAITLPSCMISLGEGVLSGNSRMETVTMPLSVRGTDFALPANAFVGSYILREFFVPDYVVKIGAGAFKATNIANITFGTGGADLKIEESAFEKTPYLMSVVFPSRLVEIGTHAFFESAVSNISATPANGLVIGEYAFAKSALIDVFLSANVIMKEGAFMDTASLVSAVVEGNTGVRAFENSAVSSVIISSTIIGDGAFKNTANLRQEFIGTFENIGISAFENSAITGIYNSAVSTDVGDRAFANCRQLIYASFTADNLAVGDLAFMNAERLSALDFDVYGGISNLGDGFAAGCVSLTGFTIFDNSSKYTVEQDGAVYCGNILVQYPAGKRDASLRLSDTVVEISDYAFAGNKYLLSMVVEYDGLIIKGADTFIGTDGTFTVYVAESLIAEYQDAWETNIDFIVEDLDNIILKKLSGETYAISDYVGRDSVLNISGSITAGGKTYRITEIGALAFANSTLTEVNIGIGIQYIRERAFYSCLLLNTVTIGASVVQVGERAFENCTALNTINFSEGLNSISDKAFYNCTNLPSVVLPSTVKSIGIYAFANNYALSHLDLGEGLVSIGSAAFENAGSLVEVTIPASVLNIGDYVFKNCTVLEFIYIYAVKVPSLLSRAAFAGTSKGLSIFVPHAAVDSYKASGDWGNLTSQIYSVNSICSESGFENYIIEKIPGADYRLVGYLGTASSVTLSTVMPSGIRITEIAAYAFGSFVEEIIIEEGLVTIRSNAFRNAVNLKTVTLPSSLTAIESYAFYGLSSLTSVLITPISSSSLNSIGSYAFYNASSLSSFTFPRGIKTIAAYAFSGESMNLTDLRFLGTAAAADSIDGIGAYAFANNRLLRKIEFNCRVANIADGAFSNCVNFEKLVFNYAGSLGATAISGSSTRVFENCDKLTVFVPDTNRVNAFSAAWNNYSANVARLSPMNYLLTDMDGAYPGQKDFVIALTSGGGTNTASIINYLGDNTTVTFPSRVYIGQTFYIVNKIGRTENNTSNVLNGIVIRETVTSVVVPSTITEITSDAFRNAKSLTAVYFAADSGLKTIGAYAFASCQSLREISIPRAISLIQNYAFYDCQNLTNLVFENYDYNDPTELRIASRAFMNCISLSKVTLPVNLKILDSYAFDGCRNLSQVEFSAGAKLSAVEEYCFRNTAFSSITLPDSLLTIQQGVFSGNNNLSAVYLTRRLTTGVTAVTVPHDNLFSGVSSPFVKVYVPENTETQYNGYTGWRAKTVIPNLVDDSGKFNYMLTGSQSTVILTNYLGTSNTLIIPENLIINGYSSRVTRIGAYAGNARITTVIFDTDYVEGLSDYAFARCISLRKVVLNKSLYNMGANVFDGCTSLTDITLPTALTEISAYMFNGCTSLFEIVIPQNINDISRAAFYGCTKLSRVIIESSAAVSRALGTLAFAQVSAALTIIIPNGAISLGEGWGDYSGVIFTRDKLFGDFIITLVTGGCAVVQYTGETDVDFSALTFYGHNVVAINEKSIISSTVSITVKQGTTIYAGISDRVTFVD